jgi:hypothetical protein
LARGTTTNNLVPKNLSKNPKTASHQYLAIGFYLLDELIGQTSMHRQTLTAE